VATAFSASPTMLAVTLGATGLFAAIYRPIGTAMLVDAAGDRPGRAIGINGVFGNIGVGLAPVVTAFLASQAGLTGLVYAALHGRSISNSEDAPADQRGWAVSRLRPTCFFNC
jgi:MFS family permease